MAALPDASIGIGVESVYGTIVTPTRWYEFLTESFGYDKNVKQGMGLRVGSRIARSARRVVATTSAKGDVEMEVASKGMGLLWQAAFGTGTSTLVSAATYQQLFTPGVGTILPKLTLQKGVVEAGGTVDPYTYSGVTVDGFELNCPNGDIVKAKFHFDAKALATATAYTSPTYATGTVGLFNFAQGVITIGGSVTVPTTTALAVVGTAVATVRDFSLKYDNVLKADRFNFGATPAGTKSQPTVGMTNISGSMTIEYDSTTLRDAYIADTPLALTLTFSAEALGTGNATLQVTLPEIKLNGDIPNAVNGDLILLKVNFDVLDNLTAAFPIYLATRTADSAL